MPRLRIAAFGTAVGAALMSLPASQARAAVGITITIEVGTGPVTDLAAFGGVGTANAYVMNPAAIAALNSQLSTDGSQYQFTAISGTSNFPGSDAPDLGQLTLNGAVTATGTGPILTLSETESGFTAPPPYLLISSSTGFFVNQPAGGGHTVNSSFNGDSTPVYSVFSHGTVANSQMNTATLDDLTPVTPYTISNTITFDLGGPVALVAGPASTITDEFSVTGSVVPEPATWTMMLLGFAGLGFLAYRKRAALTAA